MVKSRAILFFSVFISILFSVRCRRCDPVVPITLKFPDDLRPYLDFGIGSYWIYKDSATGRLDSVVLTNKIWDWDIAEVTNKCSELVVSKKVESLKLTYKLYSNGVFQQTSTYQTNNGNKLQTNLNDAFTEIDDNDGFYIISYPLVRQPFLHSSLYRISQGFLDTITVNSIFYNNILKINGLLTGGVEHFSYQEYYKENVGMILSLARDTLNKNNNYNKKLIKYKTL